MRLLTLLAAVAIFALMGCPAPKPAERAHLMFRPAPLDHFLATHVLIGFGNRSPIPVGDLRARCVDEAICTAVLKPDLRGTVSELLVIGRTPGKTTVIVDYKHPTRGRVVHHELPVEFTPTPSYGRLAYEHPLPVGGAIVHHMRVFDGDALAPLARCDAASVEHRPIRGVDRTDVRLYDCTLVEEPLPAVHRFRQCSGLCTAPPERYTLCAQIRDGKVTAARILAPERGYEAKITEGTFEGDACSPLETSATR